MASKALASPLIRHIANRGYAQAAPAAKKVPTIQTSVLPNNTLIASVDNGAPVTRVTIAFRAGSRYEPQTELGISHTLRSAAGLTTGKALSFIIARKLAQIGASVSASGDREFIYYTLETTHDNLHSAIEQLNNIISNQEFRAWELEDNIPRLKYDILSLSPQVRAVDLLHKAAYRRGLGNSLFISPKRIGKISSESLQHYAGNTLVPGNCAVVVVGESQDTASLVAQSLQLSGSGSPKTEKSVYYGGELRKEMGGELTHVALALPGAPAGSPQSLALAIAAKALGNGPVTKWGNDNSPLAKAVGNIGPFAAAGFSTAYSDSGLFGVVLTVPKDESNAAIKNIGKLLKNPNLSADAVKAGKNQLKLQILSEMEDGASIAENIAAQGLYTGKVKSPSDLAADIEKISSNDVNQVLSSAASNKLSMGSAGNLAFTPYVDEL